MEHINLKHLGPCSRMDYVEFIFRTWSENRVYVNSTYAMRNDDTTTSESITRRYGST